MGMTTFMWFLKSTSCHISVQSAVPKGDLPVISTSVLTSLNISIIKIGAIDSQTEKWISSRYIFPRLPTVIYSSIYHWCKEWHFSRQQPHYSSFQLFWNTIVKEGAKKETIVSRCRWIPPVRTKNPANFEKQILEVPPFRLPSRFIYLHGRVHRITPMIYSLDWCTAIDLHCNTGHIPAFYPLHFFFPHYIQTYAFMAV